MKSLLFGANATDRVDCATDSRLTALSQFTVFGWVRPTALTDGRVLFNKRTASASHSTIALAGTGGDLSAIVFGTAGGPSAHIANTNDGPIATTDEWYFVAYACDWGVSNAFYGGTLNALATLRSLGLDQIGATQQTDTGGPLIIGNRSNNDRPWQGSIASLGFHPGILTLQQIQQLQFDPRVLGGGPLYLLGDNGTGTQFDASGGAGDGTITGATLDDGPAIRRWRGRRQLWMPPSSPTNDTTLAAVATCSIGAAGALTTDIRLAGSATLAVQSAGALATDIRMAGAAQLAVTAAGELSTSIQLAGTSTLSVTAAGALQTEVRLAGLAAVAITSVGALSTEIRLAGSASLVITTAGALDAPTVLAGAAQLTISAAGALTTAIALAGQATCTIGAAGVLSTDIRLAGAAALVVTSTGALATEIRLAGSAVCEILATGTIELGVVLVFSRWRLTDASVPAFRLTDSSVPAFRLRNVP